MCVTCFCLFLLVEVHTLNDDVRGATLEAVVSRMKTVQSAIARTQAASSSAVSGDMAVETNLRFVAVSATIPNIDDVSERNSSKAAAPHFGNGVWRTFILKVESCSVLVNKLVPWCAWLLSGALGILRLRFRSF